MRCILLFQFYSSEVTHTWSVPRSTTLRCAETACWLELTTGSSHSKSTSSRMTDISRECWLSSWRRVERTCPTLSTASPKASKSRATQDHPSPREEETVCHQLGSIETWLVSETTRRITLHRIRVHLSEDRFIKRSTETSHQMLREEQWDKQEVLDLIKTDRN
jgi:hypothetical protein